MTDRTRGRRGAPPGTASFRRRSWLYLALVGALLLLALLLYLLQSPEGGGGFAYPVF